MDGVLEARVRWPVPTAGGLAVSAADRRHALPHHPTGGCLLRLPRRHELPGQLTQLIGVSRCFQGAIELFDLKALLNCELDAAVHVDLHEGVTASYRQKANNLLQIARLSRFLRNFSLKRLNRELCLFWCSCLSCSVDPEHCPHGVKTDFCLASVVVCYDARAWDA